MNMKIAIPTVAIVVAVLAVCFIASGSESERDGYTVKQHFEIGDYYYADTSMDGDTGYSCMTITDLFIGALDLHFIMLQR